MTLLRNFSTLNLFLLFLFFTTNMLAQSTFRIPLNKEKDQYINISGSIQGWVRYTEMNPGSLVNEKLSTDLVDLSVRRYRLRFSGKAAEGLTYTLLLGNNNINYYTYKEFQVKLLEAYVDYRLNDHLAVGIGKQGWTGLSRYAAPSFSQTLAHDISFEAIPLVVVYDDILRRWGIYTRAKVGNLDFRASLSKPNYSPPANIAPLPHRATFADKVPSYQFSAYLKYQFLEHESQMSPWSPGTYLGKKRVLNLGAGMLHQPKTTWQVTEKETTYNSFNSYAFDIFYEQPLPANRAATFYFSYHNHDLGENFLRNIGVNNPASGGVASNYINGPGNRAPVVGTGSIFFLQAGYLWSSGRKHNIQIQPFASTAYGLLEFLDEPSITYTTGINYYLEQFRSRISLGYENRPLFRKIENKNLQDGRRGMLVLQFQWQF